MRDRMKQKLQSAMRTLRKSINKQQFYIQFSGTEYEVAQKQSRLPEGAEPCSTGQVLQGGKCGKCGWFSMVSFLALWLTETKNIWKYYSVSFLSVSCGLGTFYSGEHEQCVQCPPGTYQDTVGQLSCEPCPSTDGQGIAGAKNVSQCGGDSPYYVRFTMFTFENVLYRPFKDELRSDFANFYLLHLILRIGIGTILVRILG